MKLSCVGLAWLALFILPLVGCSGGSPSDRDSAGQAQARDSRAGGSQLSGEEELSGAELSGEIVLYCGRSKSLVAPIIQQFTRQTGIEVKVRYGNTGQLVATLQEEGERTLADLFWAQDAGALGTLSQSELLAELPATVTEDVPERFRNRAGQWVATSGRARVLAYSTRRVQPEQLPASVWELTDDRWQGRVGWAPSNGSFQVFVTAMRKQYGEQRTQQWLEAMRGNGAKSYAKNTPIVQALASGEIDLGLVNHYYLLQFKKADGDFPVAQDFFEDGDSGNLVNVSGIGVLTTSPRQRAAAAFIEFLLSPVAQQYFTSEVFEYPVTDQAIPNPELVELPELLQKAPALDLEELEDLPGTLALLRQAGVL